MTRYAPPSLLGSKFDNFLLAPIGEEKNGMLRVLSALARLDDPSVAMGGAYEEKFLTYYGIGWIAR
jgi:hypothetical protein